jgi:hypothetical protein
MLVLVGCSSEQGFSPGDVTKAFLPPSPGQVARDAFNIYDADVRRRSVAVLSSAKFGGEEPYVRLYRLLIDDPDPTVRAACAMALGLHGTPDDVKQLIACLEDGSSIVRWEGAKALQKIHETSAVLPLARAMKEDEDADVRMACAFALGQYPEPRVFQALVGALEDPSFGVVRAGLKSLQTLTGQDFGLDGAPWLEWASGHEGMLFARQRTYVWYPYVAPSRLIDKVQFWKRNDRSQPRTPTGLEAGSPS